MSGGPGGGVYRKISEVCRSRMLEVRAAPLLPARPGAVADRRIRETHPASLWIGFGVKEFYQLGSSASFANIETSGVLDPLSVWRALEGGKAKRHPKPTAGSPSLVPVRSQPASSPKEVTAAAPSQLGAAILAVRTAAGLSQTELAAKLKTAQANIARLEKAGSIPSTNTLQPIAKATGHKLTITFTRTA